MSGFKRLCLIVAGLSCVVGCESDQSEKLNTKSSVVGEAISARPLQPVGESSSSTLFTSLGARETGLYASNELRPANMRKYLLNGAGLCTGDYDNDGLVDVFVVSQDGPNRLFRQVAAWRFEDVTEAAGGLDGGPTWGTGASFADIDNDGDLDLYVCNIDAPNQLYVNNGDGTFDEQASERGLDFAGATTMAAFADYDRDGDLDVYLLNNRVYSIGEESPRVEMVNINGVRQVHPDYREEYFLLAGRLQEAGQRDRLMQNDGKGNFKDVSAQAGIVDYDMGLSATWWDYNNDGWLDLYVGDDLKSPDHLYENQRDGTFRDVIAGATSTTPWFSMGADAADINNDGRIDFLIADMSSTTHYKQKTTMGEMGNSSWFLTMGRPRQFMRNMCYLNTGTNRLWEVGNLVGLDSTDWTWSIKFGDFDCDGWSDVFVTNGVGRNMNDSDALREHKRLLAEGRKEEADNFILKMKPLEEENLIFKNLGNYQFQNMAKEWGADYFGLSNGCSVADIDRDGDLDLLVSNMNAPLGVYRNDGTQGNRLLIELSGTYSNRNGIGAKVTISMNGEKQTRQLILARGYMSADEPLVHFGLGDNESIDRLVVEWPSGIVQEFEDVAANQWVTIREQGHPPKNIVSPPAPGPTWFAEQNPAPLPFVHEELDFDDFALQPLLPNKLSQLGPGSAWGDVNGDGRDDCYFGGGRGQLSQLFIQQPDGTFRRKGGPWIDDRGCEDMGALFFDAEGDGDLDLYVVSGGVEVAAGDDRLGDRLYLNDGQGNFERGEDGTLPDLRESGSCVCGADFDRDGDVDLFVGTRLKPRLWPLPQTSYLLINNGGKFQLADSSKVGPLVEIGLVTGAVWTDVNSDGWMDLVVATEWGPVRILQNDSGTLVDATDRAGLGAATGWWNAVESADLDGDGDMDLVATNFGLNTKYHATHDRPTQLFVSDFDENGDIDLVEAEWEGDKCYPIRGKSCSSHAMPFLNEKFDTYHEYALADLTQIYTEEKINHAHRYAATTLESCVFWNNGDGTFEISLLPRLAQASPSFGIAIDDFNMDGNLDIYLAQNFWNAQPETGLMAGSTSVLLRGCGDQCFEVVEPAELGILIPDQASCAIATDLNQDGIADLVVGVNNGPVKVFRNQAAEGANLCVRLQDPRSGGLGIGAKVVLIMADGSRHVREIHGGSGYLSQQPAVARFALPSEQKPQELVVTWPDGQTQTILLDATDRVITVNRK